MILVLKVFFARYVRIVVVNAEFANLTDAQLSRIVERANLTN